MTSPSARGRDLLTVGVAAHGGADRWAQLSEVRLRLDSGGLAFASKGRPRALRGLEAVVSTRKPRTVLVPFPRTGLRGVFEPDVVRIESMDGAPHEERRDPRRAFRGLRHALRWDDLDVHCDGHREVDGITLATHRRVMPRGPGGCPLLAPPWCGSASTTSA